MQNQIFNFNQSQVRIHIEDNEPYFCLSDVTKILEINRRSADAFSLNEKGCKEIATPTKGGMQKITFINEPNLYRVIFRSNKPEAVKFQDWIFEEVIPQIRKTGAYIQPNALPEHLRGKDLGQILSQAFATDAQHRAAQPPAPPKKPRAPRRNFKQTRFYSIETQSNMLAPTIPQKSIVWLDSQFAYSDGAFYQWQVIGEDHVYFTRLFHAVENDEPVYLGRRSESGLHNVPDMYVPRDKVRILGKAISWQVNANL